MVEKVPEVTGWYWAMHYIHGLVITHVQIVEGVVHVMDRGYTGWNQLDRQFTAWSDSAITPPV
jgi:hypothetical protein